MCFSSKFRDECAEIGLSFGCIFFDFSIEIFAFIFECFAENFLSEILSIFLIEFLKNFNGKLDEILCVVLMVFLIENFTFFFFDDVN
jgi:hypothetical protein